MVGAGLAGLRTVERLRQRGYQGRIVLLGAERHLPYDRPPLSKQVLRGERDDPWLRPARHQAAGYRRPAADDDVHLISWGPKGRTVALYAREGRLTGVVGFSAAAAVMRSRADIAAGTAIGEVLARLAP